MLTLKHFFDRPTWAAAAGYQFNYFDCLSHAACSYDEIVRALFGVVASLPDTTIREFPLAVLWMVAAAAGVIIWPLTFWVFAIWFWFHCKKYQRKYRNHMSDTTRENIRVWLVQCERKWSNTYE